MALSGRWGSGFKSDCWINTATAHALHQQHVKDGKKKKNICWNSYDSVIWLCQAPKKKLECVKLSLFLPSYYLRNWCPLLDCYNTGTKSGKRTFLSTLEKEKKKRTLNPKSCMLEILMALWTHQTSSHVCVYASLAVRISAPEFKQSPESKICATPRLQDLILCGEPVRLRFSMPTTYPASSPPLLSIECGAPRQVAATDTWTRVPVMWILSSISWR